MTAEQEVIMLRQELVAVRKALRGSEAECDSLRQLIAKEVRTRRAHRTHRTHRHSRLQVQLGFNLTMSSLACAV